MLTEKWINRFLLLSKEVAQWSKDPNKQVGCIITNSNNQIISTGFNGLPKRIEDNQRLDNQNWKNKYIIHAELNAILNANSDVNNCNLFCTHAPCSHCASVIIQSGVLAVYVPKQTESHMTKWGNDGLILFKEAGVIYYESHSPY